MNCVTLCWKQTSLLDNYSQCAVKEAVFTTLTTPKVTGILVNASGLALPHLHGFQFVKHTVLGKQIAEEQRTH